MKSVMKIWQWASGFIKKYYGLDKYKKNYEFIDNFGNVDPKLESDITNYVWNQIENNAPFNGIISWPHFIDNNEHSFFSIGHDKEQLFDLDFENIIEKAKQERANLKNVELHSFGDNKEKIKSEKLKHCLFGELSYKGSSYVINEGKIFSVNKKFEEIVTNEYKSMPTSKIKFMNWEKGISERKYNKQITKLPNWFNLDREVLHFGKKIKLEIADVLINDKQKALVAVKRLHRSADISHLVAQATNSISAIFRGEEKVENFIREQTGVKNFNTKDFNKFIIAIASKNGIEKENRPEVPFFAKLSIISLTDQRLIKMSIELAWIKIE